MHQKSQNQTADVDRSSSIIIHLSMYLFKTSSTGCRNLISPLYYAELLSWKKNIFGKFTYVINHRQITKANAKKNKLSFISNKFLKRKLT